MAKTMHDCGFDVVAIDWEGNKHLKKFSTDLDLARADHQFVVPFAALPKFSCIENPLRSHGHISHGSFDASSRN